MRKEYYWENREKILEKQKKYYKENKERIRVYKRKWTRENRNKYEKKSDIKNTETYKGRRAELYALSILKGATDMNEKVFNQEYDLLWKGKKVDVKSCNLYRRKNKKGEIIWHKGQWVFNKNKGNADLYFCICLKNNKPVKTYLIPCKHFKNGITMGEGESKYDKFICKSNTL